MFRKKFDQKFYWSFFAFILFGIVLLNIGFWGAFFSNKVVSKANFLKLFKQGRYLVIFQNNAELRPTGGFIGSFAIVEFEKYQIKKIDFNTNIYKLDNAFTAHTVIEPPIPLKKVTNGRWAMRDANFAVSFPESAEKIIWFYEQESGQKVDGVIAINAAVIEEVLKLTGPIELSKYETEISSNNFYEELAQKIEKDYFETDENKEENEPKTILKDLMPIVLEKALKQSKLLMVSFVNSHLAEKNILFYSKNTQLEQAIQNEDWGGQIKSAKADYLHINHLNLTDNIEDQTIGAKSSKNVKEKVEYKIEKINGQLVANLSITRTHIGSYDWPDGTNQNWTRVLVPYDSVLISAENNGLDIEPKIERISEAGKTVFAFYTSVRPQTSDTVILNYFLPQNYEPYSLTFQKQPGNLSEYLTTSYGSKVLFDGVVTSDLELK